MLKRLCPSQHYVQRYRGSCITCKRSKNITHIGLNGINRSQLMHCNENFRKGYNKAEQIMPLGVRLYHFICQALVKILCVYCIHIHNHIEIVCLPITQHVFRVSTCLYCQRRYEAAYFFQGMGERYKISKVITLTHNINSCCELCALYFD